MRQKCLGALGCSVEILCLAATGSCPEFPQPGTQTTSCWCRMQHLPGCQRTAAAANLPAAGAPAQRHAHRCSVWGAAARHAHTHACTHTTMREYACVHARTHTHVHTRTHTHAHTETHTHTRTHTTHTCACEYTHTYKNTHTNKHNHAYARTHALHRQHVLGFASFSAPLPTCPAKSP